MTKVEEYQQLLFAVSPVVKPGRVMAVPEGFYTKGQAVVGGLNSVDVARAFLRDFIASIDTGRVPLFDGMIGRMKLAKEDALPVCEDIVQTGFQALHYDMGMPFLAEQPQTLYTVSALYRPIDSEPNPEAKTRIVYLPQLLSQQSVDNAESKLIEYVRKHGDGWAQPEAHNTHRLAIFARVIDAITGRKSLADKIDTMIGQCFNYDANLKGEYGLKQEQEFFKAAGYDLPAVEDQIVLRPGEMLVFDNMRCVHGRVGKRRKRELINFIYGVEQAEVGDIDRYRVWLANHCQHSVDLHAKML